MKFILGKKIEMSQVYNDEKEVIPVTLVEVGPCQITQIKTEDKDKYQAIQIGYEKITKENKIKKTMKGKEFKHLKEYREENTEAKVGDEIDISIFEEGDTVKISGMSKGKGFQGGVKRHGFHGRNASHGVKHEQRTLGSVGSAYPQRVIKGRKMPGRMGYDRVTVKSIKIIKIDKDNNIMAVKGPIPGKRGTLLEIKCEK
ncbi:50S ribosomal protein L3 [Candidatus Parcubacteria bacterium]|nr:50S ribosomal protein L3 [Candidatus Parcubacteria bacterium]